MKTIVLATDGSPSAVQATAVAIELAAASDAPLHVVTAWSIALTSYGFAPLLEVPEVMEAERANAQEAVAKAVAQAKAAGLDATFEVREGYPVEEICAAARELDASLVVVGARGWGRLKRLVFGSVSTGVLHHAPCPVLVVPGRVEAERADSERLAVPAEV
jgi:nucleotide-binding universal stress UspA family protein